MLKINPEFQNLIPALSNEEYAQLSEYDQCLTVIEIHKNRKKIKKEWVKHARKAFKPTGKTVCAICGEHDSITDAHHIYPLSMQFDDGVELPIQDYVWLCPNHHKYIHLSISKNGHKNGEKFSDVLRSDFESFFEIKSKFLELSGDK